MCTGLIVPSLRTEMLLLPEFTANARLWTLSTPSAPVSDTFAGGGVVDPQFAAQTEAVAFWPVEIIASRCSAVGSSSESWLSEGLRETAVLVTGWTATFVAPNYGEPELTWPVAPANTVIEVTVWLCGSRKAIWPKVVLVSAKTAKRVIGLMAIPAIEGETVYVKKGTPELARHVVVHVETSSCAAWTYWKLLASSTVPTANEPLKFVLFVVPGGNPLMSTVPGSPGTRLWGLEVLIVTTLEARVALTMGMPSEPLEGLARSTAERRPWPPGVT